ncbi:MAG: PAS domain S-box protein [Cyanobacteriota bacterium]
MTEPTSSLSPDPALEPDQAGAQGDQRQEGQVEQGQADAVPALAAMEASDRPFVLADSLGNVVRFNEAFRRIYGWRDEQLVGEPLGLILPDSFRMAHQFGFSRFQATEVSTILGHPLRLQTLCADGHAIVSEHFIVAERRDEGWVFGATLTPLPEGTPTDA